MLRIGNAEGGVAELPWDFIRYLGDPEFARAERARGERSKHALGERIRILRREAGLTQDELANQVKVGRATISRDENGQEYANTRTFKAIAHALGRDLRDLIVPNRAGGGIGADASRR